MDEANAAARQKIMKAKREAARKAVEKANAERKKKEETLTKKIKDEEDLKIREDRLEAMRKVADAKRAEYVKENAEIGEINRQRILLNLLEKAPLPKPTQLKGKAREITEETVPWRKGAVIDIKGGWVRITCT